PAGIWGGLLTLPEIPEGTDTDDWVLRSFGIDRASARALPPLVHVFTHFTLKIAPWRVDLPAAPRMLSDPAWQWLAIEQIGSAALPAPVRRILESLNQTDA
ncbi:MAG: NUDIX domain-containing protein, partial [Azoarcus sp.]|nr:NUDIX domain-containing protein [Azoarcus sp.]